MPFELLRNDGEWTLKLSGVVDIFEVAGLHAAAVAAADDAPGVLAHLGEAQAFDTSTTQILLALKRALATSGRALRLESVPASVVDAWRDVGLGAELV